MYRTSVADRLVNHATLLVRPAPMVASICRRFSTFEPVKQEENHQVRLDHILLKSEASKPMIVMHGFLGSKLNFRTFCSHKDISSRRRCYLVEMRNHATSDHHDEHSYELMSDDIVRFADA